MKRAVLFVDDEQRILDGLRRGLRDLRHDWDLRFALGGEQALAALVPELAVVVSDMRMPDVDGVQVLEAAREQAPDAARAVLSGNSDRSASLRAARVAHRFLAKPCEATVLQALLPVLADCAAAVPGLAGVGRLPAAAQHVHRARRLLEQGAASSELAAVVEQDPALTLAVLHAACSAFFAPARACPDVAAALEHLGPAVLADLLDDVDPPADRPTLVPVPSPDRTAGALAGLTAALPGGGLRPLLLLRGLPEDLVGRAEAAARGQACA